MLDNQGSLLPVKPISGPKNKAVIVGFVDKTPSQSQSKQREADILEELQSLLMTLDVEVAQKFPTVLRSVVPATYVGKGKVQEIKDALERHQADVVVFDCDLSPQQLRNLEKVFGKPTLDRSGVIIEIFSRHARTKEAKTQVELARLEYLLPRLAHFWTHFERQRGGIGLKGMGEKQLEVDRRLLRVRMKTLKERLKAIEKERKVQRSSRQNVLKVAIVGYTNAGKSTLLNAMTHSQVLAENKLFATLDACVRTLDPDSHPPVVVIDTVGFISKIPPALIASFRSTLEEVYQADLLLHVVDGSSMHARDQFEVTEKILKDLNLDKKPRLTVINKADLAVSSESQSWIRLVAPGALRISALKKEDVERLRDTVLKRFREELELWEIVVPYSESKLEAQIHAHGSVEATRYLEKGVFYRLRIHSSWAKKLGLQKFQP